MNTAKIPYTALCIVLILMCLLYVVRLQSTSAQAGHGKMMWSDAVNPVAERASAGVLAGLIADFRVLDVFAINYEASRSEQQEAYVYLTPYLQRAQALDPQFFDVYRLASSLLAYDAKQPLAAVDLLEKGIEQRPDSWEIPFFAGFIAHDQLKDDQRAFALMEQVSTRENTPLTVITLAARFLASSSSTQDALIFLQGLLGMLPKDKQEGVKKRIQELELELINTPNTAPNQ